MHPYRKEKLGSLVREIISDALIRKLNDPRVEPLTTVTRVEMSGDLAVAKVFLSVNADDAAERRTLRAMRHARGYMQRILAGALVIRQCPQLSFEIDKGAKTARRTLQLLEEERRKRDGDEPPHDEEAEAF